MGDVVEDFGYLVVINRHAVGGEEVQYCCLYAGWAREGSVAVTSDVRCRGGMRFVGMNLLGPPRQSLSTERLLSG